MSSDLRIGIVSPDAPPHAGGMGRHVGSLIDGLQARGANVVLFRRSGTFLKNVGFSIGLRPTLEHWIRNEQISVLHLHIGPGGVLLRDLPKGIPVIVTVHHTYAMQSMVPGQRWKRIFRPLERRMLTQATRIICVSDDTAMSVARSYGIDRQIIDVIQPGFDLLPWIQADAEPSERDRRSCVFVGRRDKRKGFDVLMEAWRLVRAEMPEAALHLSGDKRRLSDQELQTLVGRSRLLVCPSRFEGFGLAAAEAIAAGTPVVATDVPGLRSVVDASTGIVTTFSAREIADAMLRLLSDDRQWTTLHEGCRAHRQRFALSPMIDAHLRVYHEVYSSPR